MPSNIVNASFLFVWVLVHAIRLLTGSNGLDCIILSDATSAVLMNLHQPATEYIWHCLLLAVHVTFKPEMLHKQCQTNAAGCMRRALIVTPLSYNAFLWLQVHFVDQLIVRQTAHSQRAKEKRKSGQHWPILLKMRQDNSGPGNTACAITVVNHFCTCTMSDWRGQKSCIVPHHCCTVLWKQQLPLRHTMCCMSHKRSSTGCSSAEIVGAYQDNRQLWWMLFKHFPMQYPPQQVSSLITCNKIPC